VAAAGGVAGVMGRPGVQQRLGGAQQRLDLQQIAIAEHRHERADPGIGTQHEEAVMAGLLGELAGIDLEDGIVAGAAKIAAVGRVADQRLVALRRLPVEGVDDGPAIGAALLGLGLVAGDDVAPLALGSLEVSRVLTRSAITRPNEPSCRSMVSVLRTSASSTTSSGRWA